jgi:cytidylate kinase
VQVTIDGPAGVGKTSVGSAVAEQFSLVFIQSGQLYRAIAYAKLNSLDYENLSLKKGENLEAIPSLGSEKLTDELNSEEIGEEASKLAKKPEVRDLVNETILEIASGEDVLAEGRDIGTQVLPDAEAKVFLTASTSERALRRKKQLNSDRDLGEIETGITKRDDRDQKREVAPLRPAEDAEVIDTTDLSLEEVVDRVVKMVELIKNK